MNRAPRLHFPLHFSSSSRVLTHPIIRRLPTDRRARQETEQDTQIAFRRSVRVADALFWRRHSIDSATGPSEACCCKSIRGITGPESVAVKPDQVEKSIGDAKWWQVPICHEKGPLAPRRGSERPEMCWSQPQSLTIRELESFPLGRYSVRL